MINRFFNFFLSLFSLTPKTLFFIGGSLVIQLLIGLPTTAQAAWTLQYGLFYNTWEDDAENYSHSRMDNSFFIGASFDRKNSLYIGPTYRLTSKSHQVGTSGTESEYSANAFGAGFLYFIDKEWRWKISATYNLSITGERTVSGTNQTIKGSGYEGSIGYQIPLSKNIWLGGVLTYTATTISEYKVSTTATDVSESYTSFVPSLTLNFFIQ